MADGEFCLKSTIVPLKSRFEGPTKNPGKWKVIIPKINATKMKVKV